MAQVVGFPHDELRVDRKFFGVCALVASIESPEDAIADAEVGDPDTTYHAREVATQDVRELDLSAAAEAYLVVGCVHARRTDIDHHLTRPTNRLGGLAVDQHLGTTMFRE